MITTINNNNNNRPNSLLDKNILSNDPVHSINSENNPNKPYITKKNITHFSI